MRIARRVVVSGRVQGVYYRAWAKETALSLGLDGWVRNRGVAVEALFAGLEADVEEMLALCREGPPDARVEGLEASPSDDPGATGFQILPTV